MLLINLAIKKCINILKNIDDNKTEIKIVKTYTLKIFADPDLFFPKQNNIVASFEYSIIKLFDIKNKIIIEIMEVIKEKTSKIISMINKIESISLFISFNGAKISKFLNKELDHNIHN